MKHTLDQKYNGSSAPKLVLFSSIAQEKIASDPNLPDNAENNKNIKLYADATAEVAKADGVELRRSLRAHARTVWQGRQAADDRYDPSQCGRRQATGPDHHR